MPEQLAEPWRVELREKAEAELAKREDARHALACESIDDQIAYLGKLMADRRKRIEAIGFANRRKTETSAVTSAK